MNWKKFQAEAFGITEKEVEKLIPSILQNYREAIKSINKELKKAYIKLSGVDPSNYYNEMLKFNRLNNTLNQITREYTKFSRQAGKEIGKSGELSASNIFYRSQYNLQWLAPIESIALPNDLIAMSVYGTDKAWKSYKKRYEDIFGDANTLSRQIGTLSNLLASNRIKEVDNIQRAIIQGLVRGQSYTKTSKDVRDIIGTILKKDGKTSVTGAMANAIRIVRSENTRIMSQISDANTNYAKTKGVKVVRVWDATLDSRTRPVHSNLDNKEENSNGYFESGAGLVKGPGQFSSVGQNVNCRCTTFNSVNGSRPTLRRGRNPVTGDNEVFDYKDFNKWAEENNIKKNKFGQYYK